jgi:hypothetical protein
VSTDASDVMGSSGADTDDGEPREDLFDEDELQRLREEAARMVANGPLTLVDVSLDGRLDDGEELADGENEAFRDRVREALDDVPDTATDRQTGEATDHEPREGWSPEEVRFNTIWEEYDWSGAVSRTVLVGALAVSDHTAFGRNGAVRCIDVAVDDGALVDIKQNIAQDGEVVKKGGFLYGRGESR